MGLPAIYKNVIGLNMHQSLAAAAAVTEDSNGKVSVQIEQFGAFRADAAKLADWCSGFSPDLAVMESTGVYGITPCRVLCDHGLNACVVNARHVKNVPGKKN